LHFYSAVAQVILIDITLAGDNAIVVGLAASQVAPQSRAKVIFWGIAAAVVMRVAFSAVTLQLLAIIGLTLAGGILLLWVCWKMFRQISGGNGHGLEASGGPVRSGGANSAAHEIGFRTAVLQIAIADISMSLDNVLAVAGVAKAGPAEHSTLVLLIGLGVSIALMAVASHFIANLLVKFPWVAWIGLLIILWVALDMIYRGSHEVACTTTGVGCHEGLWEWVKSQFP
jgi:YjbE family integral membrane protein